VLFTEQLVALLAAGLNIVEALQALSAKERVPEWRRAIEQLSSALRNGRSLADAIESQPTDFSPIYAAVVRASERTGDLQRALTRYLEYELKFAGVRKRVFAALLYPAVLALAGSAVMLFLVGYVVPRFARIYEDLSGNLPFFSALLLSLGGWIGRHGALLACLAAVAGVALAYALSRPPLRVALRRGLWRVPRLGEAMQLYELARLYGTLGMLLRSGVPIVASIDMSAGLLAPHLRAQLARAKTLIGEGRSISSAMATSGLSNEIAERMMAVGERSGQMGEMMERIAAFCDDELARRLDWTMRLLEPLLMALIGLAIGLVVVLMYMPVFELAGALR
jgi:general secretion pathway protein F